jgi:transposase
MWMKRGKQWEVPSPGQNEKVAAFGGINYATGEHLSHVPDVAKGGKNSSQFLTWLGQLVAHARHRGTKVILALDNGSIHTAKKVRKVLDDPTIRKLIQVVWLPKYAPELNEQERVWKYAKEHGIANVLFSERASLRDQVVKVLRAINCRPNAELTIVLGRQQRCRRVGKNLQTGT